MKYLFIITLFFYSHSHCTNTSPVLKINSTSRNELIIVIDSQTHIDYGLSYPVTYEFNIPSESDDLMSYRRFKSDQSWSQIIEKTPNDFFNGIEAVRFDYDVNIAYVSRCI